MTGKEKGPIVRFRCYRKSLSESFRRIVSFHRTKRGQMELRFILRMRPLYSTRFHCQSRPFRPFRPILPDSACSWPFAAVDSFWGQLYDDTLRLLNRLHRIIYRVDSMAVPKRKHSNSRTGKRRSHDAKRPRDLTFCPKCSVAVPTHVACPNCGYYMGRVVDETVTAEK